MENIDYTVKERAVKEMIADRMIPSARFLFDCFIDTEEIEVALSRRGVGVVTDIAGESFYSEPVTDFKTLISKYNTLSNLEKKEYGDRESMKMVFNILLKSFAGGRIKEAHFKNPDIAKLIMSRMENYKVVSNA